MNWVALWADLVEGRLSVERASFTESYSELCLRDGGSPAMRREHLERALLGEPLKVLALERKSSDSHLSGSISLDLQRMGVSSGIRSVPAAVAMLVNAARGIWLEGEFIDRVLRLRRPLFEKLSPAVRAVAALYFEGLGGQQIAKQTGRASRTIQNQIAAAHRGYAAASRLQFIAASMKRAP